MITLIFGLFVTILGAVILITKKEKTGEDTIFSTFFLIAGLGLFIFSVGYVSFSNITYESITPCNIIITDGRGLVATVGGGVYVAYPNELIKLHINQTRDVVVINEGISLHPTIKEVSGTNCPSGTATGC
jgi:drug/metabolite transporter (DMT)-like permease